MKRLLSILLVAAMIFGTLTFTVTSAPAENCYQFNEYGSYAFFKDMTVSPNDSSFSFDWSFEENSNGDPLLNINGAIEITASTVTMAGISQSYSWGEVEKNHWRRFDIKFSAAGCSVSLDGEEIVFAAGVSGRSDGIFFIAFPGDHYLDNISFASAGKTIATLDFESTSELYKYLASDSSGTLATVPKDSYYDGDISTALPNASYIFDSEESCRVLSVGSEEIILIGDVNLDGKINSRDIIRLKKLTVNSEDFDIRLADLDFNGSVNAKDSLFLKQTVNGKRSPVNKSYGSSAFAEYNAEQSSAELVASETVSNGVDATLTLENINAAEYPYAVITYMTPASAEQSNSEAACRSAFGAYGNFIEFDLVCDGLFHSEIIDLSEMSTWNGDKVTLRYFIGANEGDTIYIDSVIFAANLAKAKNASAQREAVKASFGIFDKPDPAGAIGAYDNAGNYVIRFDTEDKVANKVANSNNSKVEFDKESIKVTATAGADPSIYLDLSAEELYSENINYIVYTYMIPTTTQRNDPPANIYFVNENIEGPTAGYETPLFTCKKSGSYAVAIIDVTKVSTWVGKLSGFRIDYFSDCFAGDVVYIDSVIFASTTTAAAKAGNDRAKDRNGGGNATTPAGIWNDYVAYYAYSNSDEYVTTSGSNVTLYFRYNTDAAKFTARSLGDRLARAITVATGYEVSVEVYSGFSDLISNYSSSQPRANVFYTITFEGKSYCVYIDTIIIKDSSYTDVLDGTQDDPSEPAYATDTWFSDGYYVTDSMSIMTTTSMLSYHSNHETRLVETPYGTFAVIPTWENSSAWGDINAARFTLYRIFDNGSVQALGDWNFQYHTSKPNIMYAADGLVYIVSPNDQGSYMNVLTLYFDPSKPNPDGTYNIQGGRTNLNYSGGGAPGGYGYIQPILDDTNGKIYVYACGGSEEGYFAWSIYDYKTHKWETSTYSTILNTYRHCYIYGYSDGKNGIYLVAGRDVKLSTLGLNNVIYGADYAWDEVNLFHFPNMHSTSYTRTVVLEADYTQMHRQLYPTTANNRNGETFVTSDGYLHTISTKFMHGTNHHDTRYQEMWHAVYDIRTPGMKPVEIYNKPIKFISPSHFYSMRMTESVDGEVYILAMPSDRSARCEIWKETDSSALSFELMAVRSFSDVRSPVTSIIIGNNRSGSVVNNSVKCIYPAYTDGVVTYKFFTVTLP